GASPARSPRGSFAGPGQVDLAGTRTPMSRMRNTMDTEQAATIRRPPASSRRLDSGEGPPLHAFLEMRLEGAVAGATRRVLSESPLVIGRVPGVGLLLDHHTVSRRHAEMVCDPFGRWWIRDLGSTNGTTIGGEQIAGERVLSPGDVIGIGDYTLTFF